MTLLSQRRPGPAGADPSAERVPAFPDVPTLREARVDVVSVGWFGLFLPRGTPPERIARLERETLAAMDDPIVAAGIIATGSLPQPLPGTAFAEFVAAETERLGRLVRAADIRAD